MEKRLERLLNSVQGRMIDERIVYAELGIEEPYSEWVERLEKNFPIDNGSGDRERGKNGAVMMSVVTVYEEMDRLSNGYVEMGKKIWEFHSKQAAEYHANKKRG